MNRFYIASLAAAFTAASSLAVLAGGAQQAATSQQGFFSNAPTVALADRGDRGGKNRNRSDDENNNNQGYGNNQGNDPHGCVNPAGHTRGWCKHNGNNGNGRNRGGNRGTTTLSGTVLGISGNVVSFRLDNGQVVSILDNNGTALNVSQHYSLRVSNQNGQYVLGGSGNYNGGGNGQYGNQTVSGTIALVSGNTLTLTNGRTIDISQVNGNTNGPLSTLRSITAYGYVSNGVFYAQSIR
jgi:hypothetical protein